MSCVRDMAAGGPTGRVRQECTCNHSSAGACALERVRRPGPGEGPGVKSWPSVLWVSPWSYAHSQCHFSTSSARHPREAERPPAPRPVGLCSQLLGRYSGSHLLLLVKLVVTVPFLGLGSSLYTLVTSHLPDVNFANVSYTSVFCLHFLNNVF